MSQDQALAESKPGDSLPMGRPLREDPNGAFKGCLDFAASEEGAGSVVDRPCGHPLYNKCSVQVVPLRTPNIARHASKYGPQLYVFCTSLGPHSLLDADDEGWKQWFWRRAVALTRTASQGLSKYPAGDSTGARERVKPTVRSTSSSTEAERPVDPHLLRCRVA